MSEVIGKIQTLGDWAKDVRGRTAPKYLIHNILPADNLVLLSGVPKAAQKTFLAMTAALMVATGKSVGPFKPPSAEKVLYIYEEGDQPGTLARFDALAVGHGFGSIDEVDNLLFAHRVGFVLDNGDGMDAIAAVVRDHNVKLVIIDTLAKCMQGDENQVHAVSSTIRAVNQLRRLQCSVMFVHHTRKENNRLSNGNSGTPDPDMDIRGSSALCGAYETHWAVRTYNTGLDREPEKFLLINGKEFPLRAYRYYFELENKQVQTEIGQEEVLHSGRLVLEEQPDLPYVEAPAPRTKKEKET